MIQRFLRFPWARLVCVLGALGSFIAIETADSAAATFAVFVFAGVILHGLAIWRDKP